MQEYRSKAVNSASRLLRSLSRKNQILIGVLLMASLSVFLIFTTAPKPAVVAVEEETWPVTTMLANPASVAPQITLYGRVETPRMPC